MTERKENRSSRRSRRLIRQAFLELLEEREFSKITIIDIVERADLNRSTFYAHYPDIFGIVDEMQNEILQRNMQIFSNIEYRNILKDPMPYLQCITNTMQERMTLLKRIGQSGNIQQKTTRFLLLMENDIMNNSDIPEAVRNSPQFGIRVHFFLGGILNTYQHGRPAGLHAGGGFSANCRYGSADGKRFSGNRLDEEFIKKSDNPMWLSDFRHCALIVC